MRKVRLDEALVARGLYPTRSRARDAVKRGVVRVRGEVAEKPGRMVEAGDAIEVEDAARGRVSRGGLKLAAALDRFAIDVSGRLALDIGASTGGFTEVLLERGAAHVMALDVGHGQLAPALRSDPRVSVLEGLNARDLTAGDLAEAPDLLVADVSFISLKLALPAALALAAPAALLVALVKPQFEAGREAVGKGGIVRDPAVHERVCGDIASFLERGGWRVIGLMPSPVKGSDGNREFLIAATKP